MFALCDHALGQTTCVGRNASGIVRPTRPVPPSLAGHLVHANRTRPTLNPPGTTMYYGNVR